MSEKTLFPEIEVIKFFLVLAVLASIIYGCSLLVTFAIRWIPIFHENFWPEWGYGLAAAYLVSVVVRGVLLLQKVRK